MNKESIVFVTEKDITQRMLNMFLAAMGMDARTYRNCDEFITQHDSSRISYLVLDMSLPGMEGAIIYRQEVIGAELTGKKSSYFQLFPMSSGSVLLRQ